MQNQELKVYLSSLIQTIDNNEKLELIKAYVEELAQLKENDSCLQPEELQSQINYSFKIQ
ncbi:MAG: hypothetical protein LAT51_01660 [Flavobacteriaceae bacterium]|nr:hypothetical protein [Flavobacteriaceae bacterium]